MGHSDQRPRCCRWSARSFIWSWSVGPQRLFWFIRCSWPKLLFWVNFIWRQPPYPPYDKYNICWKIAIRSSIPPKALLYDPLILYNYCTCLHNETIFQLSTIGRTKIFCLIQLQSGPKGFLKDSQLIRNFSTWTWSWCESENCVYKKESSGLHEIIRREK